MNIAVGRRRWHILVVASVAYLVSHSYVFGIFATAGLEFLLALFFFVMLRIKPTAVVAIDFLIRVVIIAVGVTINAFVSYVYDLSYLYGIQWLFLAVVTIIYVFVSLIDAGTKPKYKIDYLFFIFSLGFFVFFMDFVAFGEPYTFMVEMLFILSVFLLAILSDFTFIQWWSFAIWVVFWIVVIVVGYIINAVALEKEFRFPLSYYFTKTPLIK